jgi:hypothetical protein
VAVAEPAPVIPEPPIALIVHVDNLAEVTNRDFAQFVLGDSAGWFASFRDYPIKADGRWAGYSALAEQAPTDPLANNYMSISSISDPALGRTGKNVAAVHAVIIDDVGTKLALHIAQQWPRPSAIVETSPGNAQWWYVLSSPITDLEFAVRLLRAMRKQEVTDRGATVLTQYARLPIGLNTKPCHPGKPETRLVDFGRSRYTADEVIVGLGIQLDENGNQEHKGSGTAGRMEGIELEHVVDLLDQIDNDGEGLPWDEYKRIAMGVKHQLGDDGYAPFLDWARRSSKFNENVTHRDWDGIKNQVENPLTLRSIYHGYKVPVPVPLSMPARSSEFQDERGASASPPPRPYRLRPANLDLREIRAIRWVIEGWIAAGEIVAFAGLPGVGKTTAFGGLALVVAGFGRQIGSNLRNDRPRRVLIVSEHPEQYQRLLYASIKRHALDADALADRIRLYEAVRLQTGEIGREMHHLVAEHATEGEPPLIILDTASAMFDLTDENSNAEVAAMIAALKHPVTETGVAVWVIAHAAKSFSREDHDITPRGASAYMGDVHGTGSVFRDPNATGSIFLRSIKNRAVVEFAEVEALTELVTLEAVDERGVIQSLPVRIATPVVPFIDRAARKAEARAAEAQDETSRARAFIVEFISRHPDVAVSKNVLDKHRGELSRDAVRRAIETMLNRGDLVEEKIVPRPAQGARERLVLPELA